MDNFNFINHFNSVDLNKNWVDVREDASQPTLVVTEKTWWRRAASKILNIFSFGHLGHHSDGLKRVAKKIADISSAVSETAGDTPVDIVAKNVDALALSIDHLKPMKSKVEIKADLNRAETKCGNFNAAYWSISDCDAVLGRYKELSPELADLFMRGKNSAGDTFLHQLLKESAGSMQFNTMKAFEAAFGKEKFDKYLSTLKDKEGRTPLDIAIFRGDMLVVQRFFPIVNQGERAKLSEEVKNSVSTLLKKLANPLRAIHGENCYDSLNHIRSGLHLIAVHDMETFKEIIDSLPNKEDLPFLLGSYSPALLERGYEEPCRLVEETKSEEDVIELENSFGVISPNEAWSAFSAVNQGRQGRDILFQTLRAVMREKDPSKRSEGIMGLRLELLSPFKEYDQKVDYADLRQNSLDGVPILEYLVRVVAEDPEVDLDSAVEVIESLIRKYPDLLKEQNLDGVALLDVLQSLEKTERNQALKNKLNEYIEALPETIFRDATLRSLKFVLEAKGLSFRRAGQ